MGKTLIFAVTAALMGHAGTRDANERKDQAHAAYVAGRYAEAEAGYRSALAAFGSERSLARAVAMENLGVSLRAEGRVAEARPLMEAAATEIAELAGAQSTQAVQASANLAALYWSSGELAKAAQLSRSLLGAADEVNAVTLYGNLAAASIGAGDMEQAEAYARRALELARKVLPEGDTRRAVLLNNLAQACRFNGRYLEAETDYRAALGIWEVAVGASHADFARGLMNLAAFYHERGREAGAEQLYLRAEAILEKTDERLALVVRNELADVMRAQLRYTEAKKLARATLTKMEGLMRPDDPRLLRARFNWTRLIAESQRTVLAAKAAK